MPPADDSSANWTGSPLATGLAAAEIQALEQIVNPVRLPAGTPLFNLGEEARSSMVVESGTVALTLPLMIQHSTRELVIEEKGPGSVIGWSALVPPHKFTMSGRAASDLQLASLERAALEGLFQNNRELHLKIICNLNGVIANRVHLLEALLIRELQRLVTDQTT